MVYLISCAENEPKVGFFHAENGQTTSEQIQKKIKWNQKKNAQTLKMVKMALWQRTNLT